MSFDIICNSYGKQPAFDKHQICTIGIVCREHTKSQDDFQIILQLNSCAQIFGVDLYSFQKEEDLMKAFDAFIDCYDPDVITGHDILSFDLRFLFN